MHDRGHHVGDLPATFAEYLAQIVYFVVLKVIIQIKPE